MTLTAPRDWEEMLRGLVVWARGALLTSDVTVYWGRQRRPTPQRPAVSLNWVTPPNIIGGMDRNPVPTRLVVTVINTDTGADFTVTIGGVQYTTSVPPGTIAPEGIRDALLATLPTSINPVADGRDSIATDCVTPISSDSNTRLRGRFVSRFTSQGTLSIDVDTGDRPNSGFPIFSELTSGLQSDAGTDTFNRFGWSFLQVLSTRHPIAVEHGGMIDRPGFDILLACRTQREDDIDFIETVNVSGTGGTVPWQQLIRQ